MGSASTGWVLLLVLVSQVTAAEDDRDLSTDILEFVLQRGETRNDSSIASDILGFVKEKIETSSFEEIPPEIFKFVLEEESQTELGEQSTAPPDTDYAVVEAVTAAGELEAEELLADTEAGPGCPAPSSAPPLAVTDSATFVMVSEAGGAGASAEIVLQQVAGELDRVNFVCNYSSPARAACPPSIYLVSGHASCSPAQLPDTVAAKQLAEIHSQGYGETLVPLSWDQVTNTRTCVLILMSNDCDEDDEGVTTTETSDLTTLAPRQSCGPLRAVAGDSVFRTFTSINLSGFTILLSGSTSRSISLVSQPSSGSSTYLGLTVTNFNQFGTWPLLQVRLGQALVVVLMRVMPQLPGLTGATAVTIAVTMIAGYYGAALLLASDTTNRRSAQLRRRSGQLRQLRPRRRKQQRSRSFTEPAAEESLLAQVDSTLAEINQEWSRIRDQYGEG